jgi:hypothetical protein
MEADIMKRKDAMRTIIFGATMAAFLALALPANAQCQQPMVKATHPEEAAIRAAVLDYIDGWYEGSAERMDRALHPELVKRVIRMDKVMTLSKQQMVDYTAQGAGKAQKTDKPNIVTILDICDSIATVKTESPDYIDFIHLGKVEGKWVIINVLWTRNQSK